MPRAAHGWRRRRRRPSPAERGTRFTSISTRNQPRRFRRSAIIGLRRRLSRRCGPPNDRARAGSCGIRFGGGKSVAGSLTSLTMPPGEQGRSSSRECRHESSRCRSRHHGLGAAQEGQSRGSDSAQRTNRIDASGVRGRRDPGPHPCSQ